MEGRREAMAIILRSSLWSFLAFYVKIHHHSLGLCDRNMAGKVIIESICFFSFYPADHLSEAAFFSDERPGRETGETNI